MSELALIYPMATLVTLTFVVLLSLFRTRAKLVSDGKMDAGYFRLYTDGQEPDAAIQLSRHFTNLLESPTLFYAVCIAAIAVGLADTAFLALAWLYVGLRLIHTYIHTGANVLRPRIAAYFSSWFVLVAMWGYLTVHAAVGAA